MDDAALDGWGPAQSRGALSVCFDNLGEARDVGLGALSPDTGCGAHSSVVEALPPILEMLDKTGLNASFFIEGWNLGVYPDQVREIVARGHDLALHGWVHESWSKLDTVVEQSLLDRSTDAAAAAGVHFEGFRPPGGVVTPTTMPLLNERGLKFCSPLADGLSLYEGVAILPFQWDVVDGYHVLDELAGLRRSLGAPAGSASPVECATRMRDAVRRITGEGGYTTITFHPFLLVDEAARAPAFDLIAELAADRDLWCPSCSEMARWMTAHPDRFAHEMALGTSTWS